MSPADPSNLPRTHDEAPERPLDARAEKSAGVGGGGQLGLLGLPGEQACLDGTYELASLESRSDEPLLGPSHGVSHEPSIGPCGQLELDLGDTEVTPILRPWKRADLARTLHERSSRELGHVRIDAAGEEWGASRESKCHLLPRVKPGEAINLFRSERGAWSWTGLVICDKWSCPTCGTRRARDTSAAIGVAIERWLASGDYFLAKFPDVWMLSLTMPHRDELVGVTVDKLYAAWDRFLRSKQWRAFVKRWGIVGHVRVLDVTFGGKNGGHPHFHIALFPERAWEWAVDDDGQRVIHVLRGLTAEMREERLRELAAELWGGWRDALVDVGVTRAIGANALELTPADKAAAYFLAWGLADEVGATTQKRKSHLRLLDAYGAGNELAGDAYLEWCAAVHLRQWVSSGLGDMRRRLKITDEDCDAYIKKLREKRDAALAAKGEPVKLVRPLYVGYTSLLHSAVLSFGQDEVTQFLDAVDAGGGDVQAELSKVLRAESLRLDLLRTRQRAARTLNPAPS